MFGLRKRRRILCAGLMALSAAAAKAQVSSAALFGEARDESSSVAPGVTVTATQASTGFVRGVLTGPRGNYSIEELPPGTYVITARKPGFRTLAAAGVTLEVNRKARLDLVMRVGEAHDSVTVTGAVPLVETGGAAADTAWTRPPLERCRSPGAT